MTGFFGLTLRLSPGDQLLAEVLARLRALPDPVLTRPDLAPTSTGTRTRGDTRAPDLPTTWFTTRVNITSAR